MSIVTLGSILRVARGPRSAVSLALVALVPGCRDISFPEPDERYRLEIISPVRTIAVKQDVPLSVHAFTFSVVPTDVPAITWTSADTNIARISDNGVVTGVSLGYTLITASGGGLKTTMTAIVNAASLRITMTPEVLAVGDTGIVTAARIDFLGEVIPGSWTGPWWESEQTDVAEIIRLPDMMPGQLAVVGRTPGRLFLWADGVGISSGLWITVVAATVNR